MTVLQFPRARIVREAPQPLKASEPLEWLNAFFEHASVAPWYQEWVAKWYGGKPR
jgi:hypothetical protein